jgi:hypothetical protein
VSPASFVNVPVEFTGVFTEKIEPLAKVADQCANAANVG